MRSCQSTRATRRAAQSTTRQRHYTRAVPRVASGAEHPAASTEVNIEFAMHHIYIRSAWLAVPTAALVQSSRVSGRRISTATRDTPTVNLQSHCFVQESALFTYTINHCRSECGKQQIVEDGCCLCSARQQGVRIEEVACSDNYAKVASVGGLQK